MDRALKERIIGAAVLVVVVVAVVPIFLDGPSPETEIVSEPVTLPGQNPDARKQQTIVLERDRSEPVPAASAPATTPQEGRPAPSPVREQKAAAEPPPAAKPEPSAVTADAQAAESETGMWAVQLGSFSNQANAERLAAELRGQGYAAFLSRLATSGGSLHRVRVGPQADRDSAEAVVARLKAAGHDGRVVPHP